MVDGGAREVHGTARERQAPGMEKVQELLEDRAAAAPPRVFGVYVVASGEGAERVLGWGMAFADRTLFVLDTADRTTYLSLRSPERVLRLFRHVGDVRLVWPEPDLCA